MSKREGKEVKKNSIRKSLRNLKRVERIIKTAAKIYKSGSFEKEANEIESLAKTIQANLKKVVSKEEVLKYYGL